MQSANQNTQAQMTSCEALTVFTNDGEIDIDGITTFGISAKVTDNPIGFFGTGLKYAIAILLRLEHKITIFSGTNVLEFSTQEKDMRGKKFAVVTMNGQPLGFTTELGKNWDDWQAFREIYSNMLDENGSSYVDTSKVNDIQPESGKTKIIVESNHFAEIYAQRGSVFLDTDYMERVCFSTGTYGVEAYEGKGDKLFYRGIRIADYDEKPFKYVYNLTGHTTLTENRTLQWQFQADEAIVRLIATSKNKEFIEDCLTCDEAEYREASLSFSGVTDPSDEFMEVVAKLKFEKAEYSPSAAKLYQSSLPTSERVTQYRASGTGKRRIMEIEKRLRLLGFKNTKIVYVETLGDKTIMADAGTIYVSKTVLTWNFQDHLSKLFRAVLEESSKDPLGVLVGKYLKLAQKGGAA